MDNNFDNDFKHLDKTLSTIIKASFALWLGWALICLAGVGGFVYVIYHFVSKAW